MELRAGDVIDDKYEVIRLLGRGGMGVVYEGRHPRIHRRVAIKVLHSAIASDPAVVQRFEREAQAAGRIGSEHIVEVIDIGALPSGERFMVMEFLEGRSLAARLAEDGSMLPEQSFPVMAELLEGLAAAHDAGIVHRDLKPDNVWLARSPSGRGEFVKILDFGISKFRLGDRDAEVTKTGVVVGTPSYMAPEQARADRDVDARADVYAVGLILYRCLAGQLPFEGATYNELMYKVALEDPPPLDAVVPGLDPEVVAIVHRALERDREARYPTALAFRSALVGWLQQHGFPVSLAVVDLLQSGDRVGAELLQSGEAWARPDAAFDGAATTRHVPRSDRGQAVAPTRFDDHTDVIDPRVLAAMSAAERRPTPRPVLPDPEDEIATVERPAHRPLEATTRWTASRSAPPNSPPRPSRATVAVATAASALLVSVLLGIALASSPDPAPPLSAELTGHALRVAQSATEAAGDPSRDAP